MSVDPAQRVLSSLRARPWASAVVILIVIVWRPAADLVGAWADIASLMAALGVTCGTAAKYRNHSNLNCPLATS